jgi:short-subunit dehydrogenase
MEIENSVIIFTGATGGIGRSTCTLLAEKGAKLVLAARTKETLTAFAQSLPDAMAVTTDMRKPHEVKRLVDTAVERYGRVDILINGAAQGMWQPLEKIDLEQYKSLMDLNVYGPLLAMQAVIPVMRAQGGGMILNISSASTKLMVVPNLSGYASTKYALNSLSLTAREELAEDNIVVSTIYPILVMTEFGVHAVAPEPEWLRHPGADDPHLPMVMPEKVAEKIAALIGSGEAECIVD